ncbi:hypothetical protein JR338_05840 [Chloroflexota bacterium]|nr:hypothetical protein JR338_05840 [Chloroflexota bacterium]
MKKRNLSILLAIILLATVSACRQPDAETEVVVPDATELLQTAVYLTTQDAAQTKTALPAPTLTPISSWTPEPTIDRTRGAIQTPTSAAACNQAAAGHPFDITIPDDTILAPGENFSKTWRLENVGTCTWSRAYTIVFFSGNSLSAYQSHALADEVAPGQAIDVTVDMVAPNKVGSYQSNWMISDPEGRLFGIGPNGDAPFWVRIEVSDLVTSTPTITPTTTVTPVAYQEGSITLQNSDQFDLDAATVNPGNGAIVDLSYAFGGEPQYLLTAKNGAVWAVFGLEAPGFGDCSTMTLTGNAIGFEVVPEGTYICYQTSGDLYGRLMLDSASGESLNLDYLTWSIP